MTTILRIGELPIQLNTSFIGTVILAVIATKIALAICDRISKKG